MTIQSQYFLIDDCPMIALTSHSTPPCRWSVYRSRRGSHGGHEGSTGKSVLHESWRSLGAHGGVILEKHFNNKPQRWMCLTDSQADSDKCNLSVYSLHIFYYRNFCQWCSLCVWVCVQVSVLFLFSWLPLFLSFPVSDYLWLSDCMKKVQMIKSLKH